MLADSKVLEWFQNRKINQFLPSPGWFETEEGVLFCASFSHLCVDFIGLLSDTDPKIDNHERMDVFMGHDPSGTSVTNMAHWRQLTRSGKFQAYDYGSTAANMAKYNQSTPPDFNPSKPYIIQRIFE